MVVMVVNDDSLNIIYFNVSMMLNKILIQRFGVDVTMKDHF